MKTIPRAVSALATAVALAAASSCALPQRSDTPSATAALSLQDLKIDTAAYPALDHLEVQAEAIDNDPSDPNAPGMILTLRELGIRSSANYKLWLHAAPHPLIVKVRINVYADAQQAAEQFTSRYSPEDRALAIPLPLGDEAFKIQDRLVAMRLDRVQMEFLLKNNPERLMATATAYEAFLRGKLAGKR